MDFQRIFLFLIFSFSLFFIWEGWQRENQPIPEINSKAVAPNPGEVPEIRIKQSTPSISVTAQTNIQTGETITVLTDYLRVEVNKIGGDIRRIEFLKHFDTADKNKPFVLFQQDNDHTYIAQSGLLGHGLPNHNTLFMSKFNRYELTDGADSIELKLTDVENTTTKVSKKFLFHRSSYLIEVSFEIENLGNSNIKSSAYFQLVRDDTDPAGGTKFVPTYTGPAIYTEHDKFQKIDFKSLAKKSAVLPKPTDNGWVGMLQHYFVAAWLPTSNIEREFYAKQLNDKLFSVGLILPVTDVEPGKIGSISIPLYVGPAQSSLDKVAPGLGLTVDYGFLTIIAKPIFWLLTLIHGMVQNWGLAIILLTILIKLAFFPLSAASYRSMAKMRVVAPKLAKIKEQFSDDRERLNRAMMELYKTEKINPLGGCLPVVIQIPVFISLYWSILASVEMRYAPFIGWITDLSQPDVLFSIPFGNSFFGIGLLPIIMGVSMFLQSKLNPTPPDPMQAKLMQIMPIAFSFIFFFFPAGLVLYSVVNNVLSIAQQWFITRSIEAAAKGVAKV